MKSPHEWGREEWITCAFLVVLAVGAYKELRGWTLRTVLPWMLHRRILLPPGHGLLHLGTYASLDPLRIICVLLLLAAIALATAATTGAPFKRARTAQDQDKDRDIRASTR